MLQTQSRIPIIPKPTLEHTFLRSRTSCVRVKMLVHELCWPWSLARKSAYIHNPALGALQHPFFHELFTPNLVLPTGILAPWTLFDFTQSEYDNDGILIESKLLPDWLPETWMEKVRRIHIDNRLTKQK